MKSIGLQLKVVLLVAGAMAISIAVSVLALTTVYGSLQDLERINREDFENQRTLMLAAVAMKRQVQEWKNVLLRGHDDISIEEYWQPFLKYEEQVNAMVKEAHEKTPYADVRAKLDEFLPAYRTLSADYRKAVDLFAKAGYKASVGDDAVAGMDRGPTAMLLEAQVLSSEHGKQATVVAVSRARNAYRAALVGTVVVMIGALLVLWFFFRRAVLTPMSFAVGYAERIARGDLTSVIKVKTQDEAGQLLAALKSMNESLAKVVNQVRGSAESVVTASGQVAATTTDLSQHTEEQASSLEQTAASMEELASTVRQNADNARQADELARGASKRAEQGGAEVVNVVTTMGDISASARRIEDIISVIDGIAFQTNILALNAAVEAARAGEQGRGFAVVASEVRSLAQRSAQAAKEIKDLIGSSVQKVEAGTRLVEQAGDTIQALVIDVKRVSELMGSIAEASAEQSRGVQQVNQTVTQMDKVVQQNASAVQQSASAAEGMRLQAESLARAVSAFRLTDEHEAQARAAAIGPVRLAQAPRGPEPAPSRIVATSKNPKTPAAATAGGDDWEEF